MTRRDIPGYEGLYYATISGDIFAYAKTWITGRNTLRSKSEVKLKPRLGKWGYFYVVFCKEGKTKTFKVHRLIAITFLTNPDSKPDVNHIDGNKQNNNISNLEWCTKSENVKHAYKIGLKTQNGENNPKSKLTNSQAEEIRNSKLKTSELAKLFNVCNYSINKIRQGKSYKVAQRP